MSYVNFNRALSRAQIEALTDATNGKIYFATDGGIYVGNANGKAERKDGYTPLAIQNDPTGLIQGGDLLSELGQTPDDLIRVGRAVYDDGNGYEIYSIVGGFYPEDNSFYLQFINEDAVCYVDGVLNSSNEWIISNAYQKEFDHIYYLDLNNFNSTTAQGILDELYKIYQGTSYYKEVIIKFQDYYRYATVFNGVRYSGTVISVDLEFFNYYLVSQTAFYKEGFGYRVSLTNTGSYSSDWLFIQIEKTLTNSVNPVASSVVYNLNSKVDNIEDKINPSAFTDTEMDEIIADSSYDFRYIYVDDYPTDILPDVLNENGYDGSDPQASFPMMLSDFDGNSDFMGHIGTNRYRFTGDTIDWNDETYGIWIHQSYDGSKWVDTQRSLEVMYGLLPINTTYADLYPNSLVADINNYNFQTGAAKGVFAQFLREDSSAVYSENLNEAYTYQLVYVER